MRILLSLATIPLLLLFSHPALSSGQTSIYHAIDPAFVVNIQDGARPRFMQVKVQVMTYDQKVPAQLTTHMPAIRHAMILLLSAQTGDTMRNALEREQVRAQSQAVLQQTLTEVSGLDGGVEAVYFTDLVIQ